ncbi:MAG: acetyl-CoA C-acyltransferase [Myxococcota bacterium]|nr:acetyl-CoA C-acyltransferase [Myxococcota bacterium]
MLRPHDAVLVAAKRTPIARAFKGSLVDWRADDLAAWTIQAALGEVPELDPSEVEDVLLGCAQPAGEQGYNMARPVSLLAGLAGAAGATVNRYCASSLQALRMAYHAIRAGEAQVQIAAGVEAISRYHVGKADGMEGSKNPRFAAEPDLPDVYLAMGETAERVADTYGVTREQMDTYAVQSQRRAVHALETGCFEREIVAVPLGAGRRFDRDESPRAGTSLEGLQGLRTVFREDGRVTAGNACPLNDGAAAAVVMSGRRVTELGLRPRARIIATAVSSVSPELMGMGPVESTRRVLKAAGMTLADVDRIELNEAFAAQVIPCQQQLGIRDDRLNVRGGALALGHPFGMTGVRLVTTLLHTLEDEDLEIGLATLCVGGGQGMALLLQRL